VTAGERVVVAANFLIDAESNLKAALDQFAAPRQSAAKPLGDGTSMHQGTDGGGQDRRTDGKTAENDP
jgi:Cu(I)/Ag(I) efflux system membrane fusion protein